MKLSAQIRKLYPRLQHLRGRELRRATKLDLSGEEVDSEMSDALKRMKYDGYSHQAMVRKIRKMFTDKELSRVLSGDLGKAVDQAVKQAPDPRKSLEPGQMGPSVPDSLEEIGYKKIQPARVPEDYGIADKSDLNPKHKDPDEQGEEAPRPAPEKPKAPDYGPGFDEKGRRIEPTPKEPAPEKPKAPDYGPGFDEKGRRIEPTPKEKSVSPDEYRKEHGKCPGGYHWDGSKCTPSSAGAVRATVSLVQARAEITYKGKKMALTLEWEKPSRFFIRVHRSRYTKALAEKADPRSVLQAWTKTLTMYGGTMVARDVAQPRLTVGFRDSHSKFYSPEFLREIRKAFLKEIRYGKRAPVKGLGGGGRRAPRDPVWITARYPGVDIDGKPFKKGARVLYWPNGKKFMQGPKAEQAWRDFQAQIADEIMYNASVGELSAADKEAYKAYFKKKMKEWGIKSPADLDDAKKKKFFADVDQGWKSKDEKKGALQKAAPLTSKGSATRQAVSKAPILGVSTKVFNKAQATTRLMKRAGTPANEAAERIKKAYKLSDAEIRSVINSVYGKQGSIWPSGTVRQAADNKGLAEKAQQLTKQGQYAQAISLLQKMKLTDIESGSVRTALIQILDNASYGEGSPKIVNKFMENFSRYVADPASMHARDVLKIR